MDTTFKASTTSDPVDYVEVIDEPAAAPPSAKARDPRAINRLDPEIVPTHYRLEAWAKMARADPGVGWKRCSPIASFSTGRGQSGAPTYIDADDEVTDAAVAHLGDIDRRVIWAYYVDWYKARLGEWWRLTGMKEKPAKNVLNRARWRIHTWHAAGRFYGKGCAPSPGTDL